MYMIQSKKLIDLLLQEDYNKRSNINQIYKNIFSEDIKIKINENPKGINHKKDSSEKILEKKNQQIENNEIENELKLVESRI